MSEIQICWVKVPFVFILEKTGSVEKISATVQAKTILTEYSCLKQFLQHVEKIMLDFDAICIFQV